MSPKAVNTPLAPKPVGPYNQGVIAENWLYCSGQIALDATTGEMVGTNDISIQTRQVLSNLCKVLNEAGAKPSNVIKTTIYLINLDDFSKVNEIYSQVFDNDVSPARACVEVAALPKGALIEIDCVAWLSSD